MVRTWISLVLAVVFAIAAMPGSMAMPSPKPNSHTMGHAMAGMDCCQHAAPAKAPKSDNDPCKSMSVCFGVMACFGLAALPVASPTVLKFAATRSLPMPYQSVSGLSIPPDDPPPIAG